jgi:hypothetical protein
MFDHGALRGLLLTNGQFGRKSTSLGRHPLTLESFLVSIMPMSMPLGLQHCKAASLSLLVFCWLPPAAHADWQRTDTTLAWRKGTNLVWRFCFDPKNGKPFFHPLTVAGGPPLTNFRPEDHPWHYGLWFSWKYINRVNYWEEDRQTGHAEGVTGWTQPKIKARPDGSARIRMNLTYRHPSGRVDMMERRELQISAPGPDGSYSIDWRAHFTVGKEGALLDRTPLLGEPDGKVNGGYAGLGIRLAGPPRALSMVCSTGLVTRFESDRARPAAAAVGCNFTQGATDAGGIAILSDPANAGENAPWYLINSEKMRFACAAILAPKPLTVPAHGKLYLHYLIAVRPRAWTPETLQASAIKWLQP